jgi:hypothetical protein
VETELAVPTVPVPRDRWPYLEVRWQTLPDGGWISAHVVTPFLRVEWAARWYDDPPPWAPPFGFADRVWTLLSIAAEVAGA